MYYATLEISVLADLIYQENGDYPCDTGKVALALTGHMEISMGKYSTSSEIKKSNIEKSDILHIEPEVWNIVKGMENKNSCKNIIATSKSITKIQQNVEKLNNAADVNGLKQALQQYATLFERLAESIKPIQINGTMTELSKQFSLNSKTPALFSVVFILSEDIHDILISDYFLYAQQIVILDLS